MRRLAAGVALLLLASWFQFHFLTLDQRFHPDEAWFMTFARAAAVNGDWLLPGALDKPPLSLYLSALSMVAFGNTADAGGVLHLDAGIGEFAGKLPNVMLALLLAALMSRLAMRVYRDPRAALVAGLLTALSPYALVYGASAFTDMSLLFFSIFAVCLALEDRWAWAGVALGLAFWSKQQALFVAPFLVYLLMSSATSRRDRLRFMLPLAIAWGALLIWDGARAETSIFLQAAANNAPENLIAAPPTWMERALSWLRDGVWLLGPPAVTGALIAFAAFSARTRGRRWSPSAIGRASLVALVIYSAVHIVFNFNVYDRYILLCLPLLILPVSEGVTMFCRSFARFHASAAVVALVIMGGVWMLNSAAPIGGDRAEYAGIDALAAHLKGKPVATVVYDPWLGWQLGYYLGQWHDKRRVHFPTAQALVDGALALDEAGDRYLVAPLDQPLTDWLAALRDAGFKTALDYESERFIVYRLTPPSAQSPKD